MDFDWQGEIREIAADHYSPASTLARNACDLLSRVTDADPELIAEVARGVALAQPAMASLVNVANVALRAMQSLGVSSVPKALQSLMEAVELDRRAAAHALNEELDEPVTVVTHSASASVLLALQLLQRQEMLRNVVCSESRPILEGTAMTRWLVEQGFEVTLTNDVGLAEYLKPGAIFIVGTDALLPTGVVNKLGTRLFATWARLAGVPTFALGSRDKIYPPEIAALYANPQRPASELIKDPPEKLTVDNRAFDTTSYEVWSGVFVGRKRLSEIGADADLKLADGLKTLIYP